MGNTPTCQSSPSSKRTTGVVTVSRSDYGIYQPVLRQIQAHSELELSLFATGMHLSSDFGSTIRAIEEDGFPVTERVEMLLSSDTPEGIAKSIGVGILGFAQVFSRSRPDILLVLGDRFEMYASVCAALPFKIPVAHIHGGEVTEGAIDESIRHAITKMSHLHFASTDIYANRLRQLGEEDWRITVTGAPGLDNISSIPLLSKEKAAERFGFDIAKPLLVVTFHPVTLEYEQTEEHITNLLKALDQIEAQLLFTYPNADTSGRSIINKITEFASNLQNATVVINAGQQAYLSLLNCADGMVGNSSSGIIEAASFGLPVVNIGNRQRGRVRSRNVVDCGYSRNEIVDSIHKILRPEFRRSLFDLENPYGDGHSAERIAKRLAEIEINQQLLMKKFVDCGVN